MLDFLKNKQKYNPYFYNKNKKKNDKMAINLII